MTEVTWGIPTGGTWDVASNWSGDAVPGASDDALLTNAITGSATYTVTLNDTEGPNSITLNNANVTLNVTASGNVLANTMTLDAGIFGLAGLVTGSTITVPGTGDVSAGAAFAPQGGTLDGVTWQGPLTGEGTNAAWSFTIKDGITLLNAAGTGPGTLDMTSIYQVSIFDADALNNLTIVLGATNASPNLIGSNSLDLNLGASALVTQTDLGATGQINGMQLNNLGTINAASSGGSFTINSTTFDNSGTFIVSGGDHAFAYNNFTNTGSVDVTGSGVLTIGSTGSPSNNAAITVAQAGSLIVSGSMGGTGDITLASFALADVHNLGGTVTFEDGKGTLRLEAPSTFTADIAGFQKGDKIDLPGTTVTKVSYVGSASGGVLSVINGGFTEASLNLVGNYTTGQKFGFTGDGGPGNDITVVPCFAEGTRIGTQTGEVAVEALRVGDQLPVRLGGRSARVRWIGHRRVDCRRHPRPWDIWPVRVRASAFGAGMPHRDLWLSPDHAVFVEGNLIPIRYLVNGTTVAQVETPEVSYWHVELDRHDVLLAEGLPAESFLDTGNRCAFENGGAVVQAHPDFAMNIWATQSCAPLVLSGPALTAARASLQARVENLGFTLTGDPDLRLIVDGRALRAEIDGQTYRFALPKGAREIRLASRTVLPASVYPESTDHRWIGVAVASLLVDGADVPAGDARRTDGWHAAEGAWQWTNGDAGLACPGARRLEVTLAVWQPYWAATRRVTA